MKIKIFRRWVFPTLLGVALAFTNLKAQQADYPKDELLIKFSENAKTGFDEELRAKLRVSSVQKLKLVDAERWDLSFPVDFDGRKWETLEQLLGYLNQLAGVKYAEPNYIVRTTMSTIPNDALLGEQWALNNTGQAIGTYGNGTPDADIDAVEAWDIRSTSPDVKVAILDTGVDWHHRDLVNNIFQNLGEDADGDGVVLVWDGTTWIFDPGDQNGIDDDGNGFTDDFVGWDFINNDNNPMDNDSLRIGTSVAGVIGASGDNNIGIAGVTWDVQMVPIKLFNDDLQGNVSDIILALEYAETIDVDFTCNSWFVYNNSTILADAISEHQNLGKLFIARVLHDTMDIDITPRYPASYDFDNIITVAASNFYDELTFSSGYGAISVDLAAPGRYITTTYPNDAYTVYFNSMTIASGHVAGALALMMAEFPTLDYLGLKNKLLASVDVLPSLAGKCVTGGRLNLLNALTADPTSGTLSLAGNVRNCNGDAIDQVELSLAGSDTVVTQTAAGEYLFTDLASENYTLTPSKTNATTADGISGVDLLLIKRHILGTSLLTDPCDLIAADVDGSCEITGLDLLHLKRIILNQWQDFPSGKIWRFVPEGYVFPTNTFPCNFPESINYSPLSQDGIDQNFIGIKLGDVNQSANSN